jgi:hypothetical protein
VLDAFPAEPELPVSDVIAPAVEGHTRVQTRLPRGHLPFAGYIRVRADNHPPSGLAVSPIGLGGAG